ncbi:MAG: hypothetical protein FE78DRAFT_470787 [Acidomyces sp. 'richmondensis']|nr:MAG: hypothetical protein FE78DRAFT_470787 [Acidomyces sp. 'richmondensis']
MSPIRGLWLPAQTGNDTSTRRIAIPHATPAARPPVAKVKAACARTWAMKHYGNHRAHVFEDGRGCDRVAPPIRRRRSPRDQILRVEEVGSGTGRRPSPQAQLTLAWSPCRGLREACATWSATLDAALQSLAHGHCIRRAASTIRNRLVREVQRLPVETLAPRANLLKHHSRAPVLQGPISWLPISSRAAGFFQTLRYLEQAPLGAAGLAPPAGFERISILIPPSTTVHFTASRFARRRLLHLSGPRTPPAAILCPRECSCVFAGRRSNVEKFDKSISRTCPLAGKSLPSSQKALIRPGGFAVRRSLCAPATGHEVHRHFRKAQYRRLAPFRFQGNLVISIC